MSKKQVLLFVGEDITAHLIMNDVVKAMLAGDTYEPVLFFPKNAYSAKANLPELREYSFFEKGLLRTTVYPFIDAKNSAAARNLSPQQMAEMYGLEVRDLDNVNDPSFVAEMEARENIACAFSIRCTQIFHSPIIEAINRQGLFLNLHSGLLPEYRGVMPTLRRMYDIAIGRADSLEYGCTLHKIDIGIDTGNIIEVKSLKLDQNHSGYMATLGLAKAGAESINAVLGQIKSYTFRGYPQQNNCAGYFTFPTATELNEWKRAGIRLVRREEVKRTLVEAFSKAGSPHGEALACAIDESITAWYKDNRRSLRSQRNDGIPSLPLGATDQSGDSTMRMALTG